MKKASLVMMVAGLCLSFFTVGLYMYSVAEGVTTKGRKEIFIQILQDNGVTVSWGQKELDIHSAIASISGKEENIPIEEVAAVVKEANVISFVEKSDGSVFFLFGTRTRTPNGPRITEELGTPGIRKVIPSFVPSITFDILGGGIFSWDNINDIPRIFPFEGMDKVTGSVWPQTFWQALYASVGISGIFIVLGLNGMILFWVSESAQNSSTHSIVLPSARKKREERLLLSSPPISKQKEDIEQVRGRVFAYIEELIEEQQNGEVLEVLRSLHQEAKREEREVKLSYMEKHRIPAILEKKYDVEVEEGVIEEFPPKGEVVEEYRLELPIDQFIPNDLSRDCVKTILLTLLGIGGKPPYFGFHRCLEGDLRRGIINKGFTAEEWSKAFNWLTRTGILLHANPHRTGFGCSINPKKQNAFPPGDQIVGILVALRRQIQKGG